MRDWMIELREKQYLSIKEAAKRSKCSIGLLKGLEDDWITHPNIAARVAHIYGMTPEQYNMLVAKERAVEELPPWIDPPTRDSIGDEDREGFQNIDWEDGRRGSRRGED